MAVVLLDGKVRVSWVSAIVNTAAPTAAELNAGTALQSYINPDGLDITTSTNMGPTGNLGSRWATERVGSTATKSSLTYHHDSASDVVFNSLVYGTNGYLVVRRGTASTTAWAAGQKVEVYPMECGEVQEVNPKADGSWDAITPLAMTGEPQLRAVVA